MWNRLQKIGPGAMIAAAFIGPGTVTTASLAGASYGYVLLWAVVFSVLATLVLQEMTARLGVVGNMGLGEAIREKAQNPILKWLAMGLVLGAILVGNAAYEAGNLSGAVIGFQESKITLLCVIGSVALLLLLWQKQQIIQPFLVTLVVLMSGIFITAALWAQPDWGAVLRGVLVPKISEGASLTIISLIGTTVVPYNLFLHASTVQSKFQGPDALKDARWDTLLSIILGGLITLAIMVCAAAVVHSRGGSLSSPAELTGQLVPLMGVWADDALKAGFLAAGLSSAITAPLAAGLTTKELFPRVPRLSIYVAVGILLIGLYFALRGEKPLEVIVFAQIANGLLLPIIAGFLIWIMNDPAIMGKFKNNLWFNVWGAMVWIVSLGIGIKGLGKALALF
ncbi:MAG: Nramp family divalent metal transporter [Bacteroidota bacterium]